MAEGKAVDVSVEQLRDQLDTLWEKHLLLLDSYHQAQQQLGRHFSSGFFSLAQASFKSMSRVRYGQDYYDDRMQATRRFSVSLNGDVPSVKVQDEPLPPNTQPDKTPDSAQQPTPPSTPPPDTDEITGASVTEHERDKEEKTDDDDKEKSDKEEKTKKPPNPLHWFGILVPPQLRASQQSFVSAIEDPIIKACNNAQELRQISLEIRKLRKDIKKAGKRST